MCLSFSVDNLSGISEPLPLRFRRPISKSALCIKSGPAWNFVPWKHYRAVTADLKPIYKAATEKQAKEELDVFAKNNGIHFIRHITKSWRNNWAELSTFFKYAPSIRKLIYTTNPIESFHRSVRKVTKTRVVFPTEDSLVKLFYLVLKALKKKMDSNITRVGPDLCRINYFLSRQNPEIGMRNYHRLHSLSDTL